MSRELWTFAATSFAAVFSIVDPFAAVPVFLAMTPGDTRAARRRTALLASIVCGAILLTFALLGNRVFELFGITPAAFRAAGGVLLLVLSLDMMRARHGPAPHTPEEQKEGLEKNDVAITPLAIPLLAGPGAISTVTLLGSEAQGILHLGAVVLSIGVTAALSWLILAFADRLLDLIGQIGMKVITRLMGLILAGIGAQFILSGVREFLRAA